MAHCTYEETVALCRADVGPLLGERAGLYGDAYSALDAYTVQLERALLGVRRAYQVLAGSSRPDRHLDEMAGLAAADALLVAGANAKLKALVADRKRADRKLAGSARKRLKALAP